MPTLEEQRKSMGDVNADGVLTQEELLTALEDKNEQAIDAVIYEICKQRIISYLTAVAIERQERLPGEVNAEPEIAKLSRDRMQADIDKILDNARTPEFDNSGDEWVEGLRALESIEIPEDIARFSEAVGLRAIVIQPEDLPSPAPAPKPQWDPNSRDFAPIHT